MIWKGWEWNRLRADRLGYIGHLTSVTNIREAGTYNWQKRGGRERDGVTVLKAEEEMDDVEFRCSDIFVVKRVSRMTIHRCVRI